jgi:hypothetical protein
VNRYLPADIAVQWSAEPGPDFHARKHARRRRYAYLLLESAVRPAVEAGAVGWVFRPLDVAAMEHAAAELLGEHDFSAFRAAACQALSPVKTLYAIRITRRGAYWRFEFEASAFLHHMVRNLMGLLLAIGQGQQPPCWAGRGAGGARSRACGAHLCARRTLFSRPAVRRRTRPAQPHARHGLVAMNRRTRIKICGLRDPEMVAAAVQAGADAVGFVFYPPSVRAIGVAQAAELVTALPPFVTPVGLFVNAAPGRDRGRLARHAGTAAAVPWRREPSRVRALAAPLTCVRWP